MTSKRRRERRAAMRAMFEEKLEAEMGRRIARLPQPPVQFTSGPANAFRVGEYVEEMRSFGLSAKAYRIGFLGRVPKERLVLVHLASTPRAASRVLSGEAISPVAPIMIPRVAFRARRMHAIFETETTVHRVEWWTWVPEDPEARVEEAVRVVVRLVPSIRRAALEMDRIACRFESVADCADAFAVTRRLAGLAGALAAAADEWLATPDASAQPEDRRERELSHW